MAKRYTASISRNFRDTSTGAPKVLLRGIQNEDNEDVRDHGWVPLNKELNNFFNTYLRGNGKRVITFYAEEASYSGRNGDSKVTLKNVQRIKLLGRA